MSIISVSTEFTFTVHPKVGQDIIDAAHEALSAAVIPDTPAQWDPAKLTDFRLMKNPTKGMVNIDLAIFRFSIAGKARIQKLAAFTELVQKETGLKEDQARDLLSRLIQLDQTGRYSNGGNQCQVTQSPRPRSTA